MALVPRRLLAIVGPTASGKSALALRLAERVPVEIVSCDSLQVYRGLDIGSAKPTADERARVRHHLLDVAEPAEDYSAARYAEDARAAAADISGRGVSPIVVGGTGLYLRALLLGLFPGPPRDEGLRRRLEGLAERFGDRQLWRLLRRVDPRAAARIQVRDRLRAVRAIEVYCLTGRALSDQQGKAEKPLAGFATCVLGLAPPRDVLRLRVVERTRAMFDGGLVGEVQRLIDRGLGSTRPLDAIGYRQVRGMLAGRLTPEQAEEEIVRETMRYAKRQMTWFRHQAEVRWFVDGGSAFESALAWLENEGQSLPAEGAAL
jgi:tRNA dimethylallyltransferase